MRDGPFIPLPPDCAPGKFLRREKRFLVEVETGGQRIWAHCNDTGSMTGLLEPGRDVILSPAANPRRKSRYTLERIRLPGGWASVNTALPNKMLEAAFHAGDLDFARGYTSIRREVRRGASRVDAALTGPDLPRLWIECKSATLVENNIALFPDAKTVRGQKHLIELIDIVNEGERAAMFYFVGRGDAVAFAPAASIDPEYARLFEEARMAGVEIYARVARLTPEGTALDGILPLAL
ncbi:MAG: DNA/RNA nuclease SfsA [Desulfovibrio sp.]|nr:DNA/RNA nuclease SfsA [Desulfovibrio sp.]